MSYFQISSSERRGIIVLCVLLAIAAVVIWLVPRQKNSDQGTSNNSQSTQNGKTNKYYAQPDRKVETFAFDPNTADSTTLLRLGLTPSMVRGIYKYRSMGYTYSEPADFSRVPGMTNEMWERLSPYIRIDARFRRVAPQPREARSSAKPFAQNDGSSAPTARDTVRFPVKMRPGTKIDLNASDTSALKKVPGIGSYFARQIVYYRQKLGGYASLSQLDEIDGIPEGIEQYLTVNASSVRKIDVNHATKNQLVRHPYLRVYRATSIWNYRHKYGNLKSLEDLRSLPDFSDEDIQRLAPYLEFKQ